MKRLTMFSLTVMLAAGALLVSAHAQSQPQSQPQPLGDYARSLRSTKAPSAPARKFDNDNLPVGDKLSIVGPAPAPDAQPEAEVQKSAEPAAQADASKLAVQPDQPAPPPGTDPESLVKPATTATAGGAQSAPEAANPDSAKADSLKFDSPRSDSANSAANDSTAAPKKSDSRKTAAEEQQKDYERWQNRIADQKGKIDLLARELDVTQREYQLRAAAFAADAGNRLRNASAWDQEDAKYKQQLQDKQKALDSAKQALDDMQEDARKSGVPSSMRE